MSIRQPSHERVSDTARSVIRSDFAYGANFNSASGASLSWINPMRP